MGNLSWLWLAACFHVSPFPHDWDFDWRSASATAGLNAQIINNITLSSFTYVIDARAKGVILVFDAPTKVISVSVAARFHIIAYFHD